MKLKDRWVGSIESKLKSLADGKSPFGNIDGFEDFGGIGLPQGLKLTNGIYKKFNLSNASLAGVWLEGNTFQTTSFGSASLAEASDHGNKFIDCEFLKTDFRGAGLGYSGTLYSNCRFVQCNFGKTVFIRARFSNCIFDECKMHGIDFNASAFDTCFFRGRYDSLWFRGDYRIPNYRKQFGEPIPNSMTRVSFEEAELHRPVFTQGCSLGTVILPKNGEYLLVTDWKRRLLGLQHQAELKASPEGKEIGIFARVHLVHADGQREYLINCDDLVKDHGEKAASTIVTALS